MTQTLTLPGVALQWKAVGPFNQPLVATVSIKTHFPFGDGARNTGSVVFPATNASASNASFFSVPLVGTFDPNGRLLDSTGNALVVPALDAYSVPWVKSPTLYEVQIDINGIAGQRGIFVAFATPANNFAQGHSGVLLADENASTSAMTGSGVTYTGTVYLSDTLVSPVLVNQSISVGGFTAIVDSIDLPTNSMAVTTTASQIALTETTFYWGNTINLGVDLSQYVNWL